MSGGRDGAGPGRCAAVPRRSAPPAGLRRPRPEEPVRECARRLRHGRGGAAAPDPAGAARPWRECRAGRAATSAGTERPGAVAGARRGGAVASAPPDAGPVRTATAATVRPAGAVEPRPGAVISPLVRRLARENGLDLRELTGSGPDGLILRADVECALRAAARRLPPTAAAAPTDAGAATACGPRRGDGTGPASRGGQRDPAAAACAVPSPTSSPAAGARSPTRPAGWTPTRPN